MTNNPTIAPESPMELGIDMSSIEVKPVEVTPPPAESSFEHPLLCDTRDLREKATPIVIRHPEKLSTDEFAYFKEAVKSKEIRRKVERIDRPDAVAYALESQEEVVNLAVLRVSQLEASRLANVLELEKDSGLEALSATLLRMRNTVDVLKVPAVDDGNFKVDILKTDVPEFTLLENMLMDIGESLPKETPEDLMNKIKAQVRAEVVRVCSDDLMATIDSNALEATTDLPWKPTLEAKRLVESLHTAARIRPESSKDLLLARRQARRDLFEFITTFNEQASTVTTLVDFKGEKPYSNYTMDVKGNGEDYPISPEAAEMARKVLRLEDYSANTAQAELYNAALLKERDWPTGLYLVNLAEGAQVVHLSIKDGSEVIHSKSLSEDEGNIVEIGNTKLANSIAYTFGMHHLPKGSLNRRVEKDYDTQSMTNKLEWILDGKPDKREVQLTEEFVAVIKSELSSSRHILKAFENIAANINYYDNRNSVKKKFADEGDADTPGEIVRKDVEKAEPITRQEVLDVYQLLVGMEAARKVIPNSDVYVKSPLNALPEVLVDLATVEERDKEYYAATNAIAQKRAEFSNAMAYLAHTVTQYESRVGRDTTSGVEMSFAMANVAVKMRELTKEGIQIVEPVEA